MRKTHFTKPVILERVVINMEIDFASYESLCIHEIFTQHTLKHPNAIALIWQNETISYDELNRLADNAATLLINSGVTANTFVPIILPRGPELIISLLAVLKIGAAYALLDDSWPKERLETIIEILNPSILITHHLPIDKTIYPIWSPQRSILKNIQPKLFLSDVKNDAPCCIFFTSGTTGQPKGVVSPHRASIRLFQENSFTHFSSSTVIPLAAPIAWDAFSLELWGALLNGGTAWILDEPYLSPEMLRKGIVQHKVNTVWITSSLFNMIIEEDINAFSGLQQIITGGERLSVKSVKAFLRQHSNITLINGYGPVESTIFATTHIVNLSDCARPDGIPIGVPVPNTQIYILNNHTICEEGNIGEICIAGTGLAVGYLCDPSLTSEKFVQINIDFIPTKIYRTGDLGYQQDGCLHFKGRMDKQLKIRGHRVEPVEVEWQIECILSHIKTCRVISQKNIVDSTDELIAFCIPATPGDPLHTALEMVRTKLVAYQCPSAIFSIEALPLTPQGKLDERALREIAASLLNQNVAQPLPIQHNDSFMRIITEAFSSVLGKEVTKTDIPFLELGGTSLGIGRVCARLTAQLEYPIPLSLLYRYPTIASLSEYLKSVDKDTLSMSKDTTSEHIPLSDMQLLYLTRHLVNPQDYASTCLMSWLIKGELNYEALQSAINYVHQRHDALKAAYIPDPEPMVSVVNSPAPLLQKLSAQPSIDEAIRALRSALTIELDPTQADIWRTVIVPIEKESLFIFGCVIHHIAFDGWSESIVATDLSIGYNLNISSIKPSSLPPYPPTLAEAYATQIPFLEKINLLEHSTFLDSLRNSPTLIWPQMKDDVSQRDLNYQEILLDKDLMKRIDSLTRHLRATRFDILLTYWAQALAKVTSQDDFCVGVPIRQRYTHELEKMLGCYINMACIRLQGEVFATDLHAVLQTRKIVQQTFSAQEIPLTQILQLTNATSTNRPPLFQTSFALQDNPISNLSINGLECTFIRQPYLALPLELHIDIWPTNNDSLRLIAYGQARKISSKTLQELLEHFMDFLCDSLDQLDDISASIMS